MGSWFQGVLAAAMTAALLPCAGDVAAQEQARQQEQVQRRTQERARKHEIIPGSELMTSREREDYRQRHAAAKTDAERDKVRAEHIQAMEARARLRGLRLAVPVAPGTAEK